MKAYTYSDARENFATVLEEAERDGAVEIRRRRSGISIITRTKVQGIAFGRPRCEA